MDRDALAEDFLQVRSRTERLSAPLTPEDQQIQAFADASPTKWHRGHTTWFWETFLLGPAGVEPENPAWGPLFNSYYEAVGPRHARPERGLLSRPSAEEIGAWRRRVDERVVALIRSSDAAELAARAPMVRLGMAHEQQHQELLLTDILAAFDRSELRPAYAPRHHGERADHGRPRSELDLARDHHGRGRERETERAQPRAWVQHPGGVVRIGADSRETRFTFDNERPRHGVLLQPFAVATRPVTVGEWAAFAADRGYETPALWLSDGIAWVRAHGIGAPAYTRCEGGAVVVYGLHGEREAHPDEPVTHLSYYEADALATWLGGRLPSEHEWEAVAVAAGATDERPDEARFAPVPLGGDKGGEDLVGLFGAVWQWTRSSYSPYPGYRAPPGAVGEYNGKFMVNQQILRGSSVLTPPGHSRATYRNFWPPHTRFQATGLRLARDW